MEMSLGTFLVMSFNFLVLLVVLTKLLYKPIQGILEERRQKISHDLTEAEKSRHQYEKLSHDAKKTLEDARAEAFQIVERSRVEAEQLKDQILTQARQEAEQLREKNRQEIERAQKQALQDLRQGTVSLALLATEKLIGDRMSKDINDLLIQRVLDQIEKGAANHVNPGGA
ncbi:ATP synthase F0 subcomplex B subunit [Hydrogenispora ethanolica]|jgi:F-type H+-transporting ATPase subunit b|uniref:ATP synthase subunit b n=1 Tax=Hydrogenispora ethanolica TaxID=1082276 RepID=A0A4R1RB66_HYDET|nr:F0F1 ATP synthase subunit B [Hydrogenispora ethanolica]TCL63023.1 ATP synthase F0 subcomplex B subunit [Hydrogenispora ethanolica]